jgi:hypothetical protein
MLEKFPTSHTALKSEKTGTLIYTYERMLSVLDEKLVGSLISSSSIEQYKVN